MFPSTRCLCLLILSMLLQYGCLVVNAPTANTVAAAEHGIALMCALSRNVSQADASMKQGKWERSKYVGVSLVDKVLAIMGFGKVRQRVEQGAGYPQWGTACLFSTLSGPWHGAVQDIQWIVRSILDAVSHSVRAAYHMPFTNVLFFRLGRYRYAGWW